MKKLVKQMGEKGFTLVELMIVVAIIGVLSAVAIPNFKKYQAKSKTSEAKVQLAAAYTAEQAFYGDYGIYAGCLAYMGYNPSAESNARYYAVGITTGSAINATAHLTAQRSGLDSAQCGTALGAGDGTTFFSAGKGNGASVATTVYTADTGLGDQSSAATQTFTIGANGVISAGYVGTSMSRIKLTQEKVYSNVKQGY